MLSRPDALIVPARTHPEVVVQAVAARDKQKAKAYADKHGIPVVLDSYQGMPPSLLYLEYQCIYTYKFTQIPIQLFRLLHPYPNV